MRVVETNFGIIRIHFTIIDWDYREENSEIKIEYRDTQDKFMGSEYRVIICKDPGIGGLLREIEKEIDIRANKLQSFNDLQDLLRYVGSPAFYICDNVFDLHEKMKELKMVDEERGESYLRNEWVNNIGKYWIIVDENKAG